MSLQLNLEKSKAAFRLSLEKAGVPAHIQAEIIVLMDVSGSFEHEHEEGTTSTLLERLVPLAKVLDPDGKFDFITFSGGVDTVQHLGSIHEGNAKNYIIDNVVNRVPGWNGGTTYSYSIEEALRLFGWLPYNRGHQPIQEPRFWKRLANFFSYGTENAVPSTNVTEQKRSIILLITDGENDPGDRAGDKNRTRQVMRESQQRGDKTYLLVIGACEHQEFEYVEALAREFPNVGIVMATDPEEFVELPDDQLISKLLVPELISWLKQ